MITANRILEVFRTGSSLPALARTEDNRLFVLKWKGGGEGTVESVSDWIWLHLAPCFGVPAPRPVLIHVPHGLPSDVTDPELLSLAEASTGVNLGLEYLEGASPLICVEHGAGASPLHEPSDPAGPTARRTHPRISMFRDEAGQIAGPPAPVTDSPLSSARADLLLRIFLLDLLALNIDRTEENPNILVRGDELYCIDFGASMPVREALLGASPAESECLALLARHPFRMLFLPPIPTASRGPSIQDGHATAVLRTARDLSSTWTRLSAGLESFAPARSQSARQALSRAVRSIPDEWLGTFPGGPAGSPARLEEQILGLVDAAGSILAQRLVRLAETPYSASRDLRSIRKARRDDFLSRHGLQHPWERREPDQAQPEAEPLSNLPGSSGLAPPPEQPEDRSGG